jgi:hypothetical protein
VSTITVEHYEAMVDDGIIGEHDRVELIEGHLVATMPKTPQHCAGSGTARRTIERLLPAGCHARLGAPVGIPARHSEPEPEVSIVRGGLDDYLHRHPGPADVTLVIEVTCCDVVDEQALAPMYGAGGIPCYWIANLADRQLEVYADPVAGAYPATTILGEHDQAELVLCGQAVGGIAVADLLP